MRREGHMAETETVELPIREAERAWIEWANAHYPSDHIGAALGMLDRIATALEKIATVPHE